MINSDASVRLLATDVEDTILGDPVAARAFQVTWESFEPDRRPLLVYNSGRSVQEIQWLVLERRIPAPEFIIGALGTELHDPVEANAAGDFQTTITSGWDSARVDEIVNAIAGVRPQPAEFLSPRKRSWHWPRASAGEVARLNQRFEAAGLAVTVSYTSGVFLDVIPRGAGKGNALAWLCRTIRIPLRNVLVAGAGANNGSMFALPDVRGIVVGNASSELFAAILAFKPVITRESMAAGVLVGLRHFGVVPEAEPPDAQHSGVMRNQVSHAGAR